MMRFWTALVLAFCLAACSSATAPSTTTPPPIAVVVIAPSPLTIQTGWVVQFTVHGLGGDGREVSVLKGQGFAWNVAGTGCSGASCGTIDAVGKYTAPATAPNPATVTVTASSLVDSTKSLEATFTISPPASFSVNPTSVEFGNQTMNTTSSPRAVIVTKTGSTPQPVLGRFNGPPGQWQNFADTNDCPSMLAVGATCTLNITFTPSATGWRGASLHVDGINEDYEGSVNVGGTGTTN
jgi:hypothetical protein